MLSYNALVAADLLLIPVQPGVGAITGLDSLLQAAAELRDEAVEDLNYRILTTMFEIRTTRTNALVEGLLDHHRSKLLRTVVSKSESLNQANLAGRPVVAYAPSLRGVRRNTTPSVRKCPACGSDPLQGTGSVNTPPGLLRAHAGSVSV